MYKERGSIGNALLLLGIALMIAFIATVWSRGTQVAVAKFPIVEMFNPCGLKYQRSACIALLERKMLCSLEKKIDNHTLDANLEVEILKSLAMLQKIDNATEK